MTAVSLPSRYEDLDKAFRGRLRPNEALITKVREAYSGMKISGGIRFLPVYGRSGSGKSCAALELDTHLPQSNVIKLGREAIEDKNALKDVVEKSHSEFKSQTLLIAVVDQFEELVAGQTALPSQFVERISLLDRGPLVESVILCN